MTVSRGTDVLERTLFFQGTQQSFQNTKRKTATRARPQNISITASKLTEISANRMGEVGRQGCGTDKGQMGGKKRENL